MKTADTAIYRQALLIRRIEEKLLGLFSRGRLNGTVHTCIGQEFCALAFAGQLQEHDFVFSSHRCHGHFIARSGDWRALLAELMGKRSGVCAGIGGSQHLCRGHFYSNGIQGGIVPVAAGMALARKLQGWDGIGMVFIGDGTLGEGVVYETMNIASKWELPLLFVCEDNGYAQSTPSSLTLAGEVVKRAEAFGIPIAAGDTWHPDELQAQARQSIDFVRAHSRPLFHHVRTYRLKGHSKGDDTRAACEVDGFRGKDPLCLYAGQNPDIYESWLEEIDQDIDAALNELENESALSLEEYQAVEPQRQTAEWMPLKPFDGRQVEALNRFFDAALDQHPEMFFIGQDVLSPYGGAFKVACGLSDKYPRQVLTTPISEAAIMGLANGLALGGMRPWLEIMFGDFMTLCMDQLINHAAKFYHMYNRQVTCPVVVRTPMGGGRGYGPTHSQTLDKFLIGLDNVTTLALNILIDPSDIYRTVLHHERHPVVVIENKIDYEKRAWDRWPEALTAQRSSHPYPIVRVRPARSAPTVTLVTYGGMTAAVLEILDDLFIHLDLKPELLVLTKISPLDATVIAQSVRQTGRLFVIEEGSATGGIGSEVLAAVAELCERPFIGRRIASCPVPIPCAKELEAQVLPGREKILRTIREALA